MNTTRRAAVVLAAGLLFLSCSEDNPSSPIIEGGGPTQLRFLNSVEQTVLGGAHVLYRIRNLTALDTTWDEEVAFGGYSSYHVVAARNTDFTVHGEKCKVDSSRWVETQWTVNTAMVEGSQHTVELKFE